jgi:hypothetical protein
MKIYYQNIASHLERLIFSNSKPCSNMLDEETSTVTATIIFSLTVMRKMHLLRQTELCAMNGSNGPRRVEMINRTTCRWASYMWHKW